ncbi:uncharacterized protein LOC8272070 isoform X2 [Ricinus communis]|uniref:uncharacterized protein LOC8272070 isoform X2 n=1 Tax=Ricinus communis TaxID=3988 RepID=UPI00201A94AC|nr:uncharacterized protein LOC8272070 isoform X2 [Ricinus communis]
MRISFSALGNSLPFSRIFRQVEQEIETVVNVLQPGPLGIVEHKFSAEEIRDANATVQRAVITWRRNANLEHQNDILKDFIHNGVISADRVQAQGLWCGSVGWLMMDRCNHSHTKWDFLNLLTAICVFLAKYLY